MSNRFHRRSKHICKSELNCIELTFLANNVMNTYLFVNHSCCGGISVCRAGGRMDLMLVLKLPSVSKAIESGRQGSAIHWSLSSTTGAISHWLSVTLTKGGGSSTTVCR